VDAFLVPAVDGMAYGLLLFVVAAGLMAAFAVGGVLNLAHGLLFAIGAYAAATLGDGTWLGLGRAALAGSLAGTAGGLVVATALRPLRSRGHLAQALLTMGIAFVGADVLRTVFGPYDLAVAVPSTLDGTARLLGHAYPVYRLAVIAAAVLIAVVLWWVLTRTRTGALVRATVDDPAIVATLGHNPTAVHGGVLAVAGALAGLAGVLGAPVLGVGPSTAGGVLLISLVVVVLGGLRSVPATLVAALGVGEVQTLGVAVLPAWAPFLLLAAMVVTLLVRRTHDSVRAA
jgi:branched-chain amino acid transport system permease protein